MRTDKKTLQGTDAEDLYCLGQMAKRRDTVTASVYHEWPMWHSHAIVLLEQFDLVDAGGRPVKTYSSGIRRRLDLVALVTDPQVLFMDEPTTGLDPHSAGSSGR